jgi:hypothetical protein
MPLPPTPLAWLGDVTEIAGLLRVTGLLMLPALLLPVPLLLSLACSARHLSSSAVCHAMAALACARNQLDKGPEESAVESTRTTSSSSRSDINGATMS